MSDYREAMEAISEAYAAVSRIKSQEALTSAEFDTAVAIGSQLSSLWKSVRDRQRHHERAAS